MSEEPKLVHRDDMDMDVAEEMVARMQEMFPGFKVVFAGDQPDLPDEVKQAAIDLEAHMKEARESGKCIDCGAQMPNFPPTGDIDKWEPPEGWRFFTGPEGRLQAWQCPACDAAEETDG